MAISLSVDAQTITKSTAAVESVIINKDSTATVLGWFNMLEDKGVVLSYNSSNIDLSERIALKKQAYSVEELLKKVLGRYDFETAYLQSHKILLRIKGPRKFVVKGYITDKETSEPLEGCAVSLSAQDGKKYVALTDSLGVFRLKLPYGNYKLNTSYIGYHAFSQDIVIDRNAINDVRMSQYAYPLKEVNVSISPLHDEVNYRGSASILSVSANDPFAQLGSLPGISGSSVSGDFHVNGGQNDENLILLDGISIYHSQHNNTLLAQFNGETVERISFYDSFIPAQYEGRLSSVTDVRIKGGDQTNHHQTIGLDLPAASLTLDGPLIKDKLTYMISGRHSWIDFMKDLFTDNPNASRTFNDITGKLRLQINSKVSVEGLLYQSNDRYNDSILNLKNHKILEWDNNLYAVSCYAQLPRNISSLTTLSYSDYQNGIYAPVINIPTSVYIHEGMRNIALRSNFSKHLDDGVDLAWGFSAACEKYNLLASKDTVENNTQKVTQLTSYLNSKIKLTDKLYGSVALNLVYYLPENNEKFFSLQPRFTLSYFVSPNHMLSFDFSRMEQFYHNICLGEIPLPTDLRMPSIDGFKPSSSLHAEIGWKYMQKNHRLGVSSFYKRRFDILGIRYHTDQEQEGWNQFIMSGDASSYGIKLHSQNQWDKWLLDLSYTYSRSYEWFKDFENEKRNPTLHDIPHMFHCATSYRTGNYSYLSVGGYIKSGTLENILDDDFSSLQILKGRKRQHMNYRLDLNFSSSKSTKNQRLKFSYKIGLYNILGNPKKNEIIDLYSVNTDKHCLPYFSVNLKFF